MAKRIDKLTPEQTARFGEWTENWVKIGLSTEPADFDRATAAALKAYEAANLKRPMVILRMGSPYAATLGGALAWMYLQELSKKVKLPKVRSQVESQVWSQVGSQVESQVESQVRSQVWSQVGSQVRSQVWSQVESQVWSQVRSGFSNYYISQFWAGWGAYVSFFRDVCGWGDPVLENFSVGEELIKSCGWTWWHENILAISDRPKEIHRDNEGRLHCETGPSIAYRDGWALWHWHGVSVPREWIEDKASLTAQKALTWSNVEQRRAACEILGWERILSALNARTINKDDDPEIGELVEVEIPEIGLERFLRVRCGTGRRFALPVPPNMKTAVEANLWTYGYDTADRGLIPEVRT